MLVKNMWQPTLPHIYQGPAMCLAWVNKQWVSILSIPRIVPLYGECLNLFILSSTPPSFSPYPKVPGDDKTELFMNDPILLVLSWVLWPLWEGKKMLQNHTLLQFNLLAVLQLLIPKALQCHIFLFVGITLVVQIKKEITFSNPSWWCNI